MKTRWLLVVLAASASGCIDLNFDPPHLVKGPRLLDIVAEPPEVPFGQDVVFETFTADADGSDLASQAGVEMRFTVCLSVAAIIASSGLGFQAGDLEDNCGEGGDDLIRLETEGLPPGSARLPGTAVLALVEELAMMMGGGDPGPDPGMGAIDPEVLRALSTLLTEVGVPLRVRVEIWRDGEMIIAGFKRFAIAQREDRTTNPPPPRFNVGGVWLSARDPEGDPTVCVPEEGVRPIVAIASETPFVPDELEEEWIESYPVVSLEGEVQTNEESAYYSWFSTAGQFDSDITQRPEREVIWTAPEEPGIYPLWLVVRDGHLGASHCRAEVEVVP
jgi:hypothetical protein